MALRSPCLCLVTNRTLCRTASLESTVALAVQGGVDMVQLREKDLPSGSLLELAFRLKSVISPDTIFIVNERVDVAMACDAQGVQLSEDGLPVASVRTLVGPDLLIGRSVHSMEAALRAEQEGADFLIAGAIFPTSSHQGSNPAGLELLTRIASNVHIPFLGIGGINTGNVGQVMASGASGVAVISSIMASDLPGKEAAELSKHMYPTG
jgi:thiamine-phosphate diphosphorylase